MFEFRNSTVSKFKYKGGCLSNSRILSGQIIEFYKCVPKVDFSELHTMALKLICRFGSTHAYTYVRKKFLSDKFYQK